GESKPIRAQGCYVDENEIAAVLHHLTRQLEPEYDDAILADREEDLAKGMETGDAAIDALGEDAEYYDEALQITLQEGKISASMLQRKLRIGYNRAARLVDLMTDQGLISGPNGAKPREVLRSDLYTRVEDL
ncbi:MAG: DNA translocase FtsK, partial [bacterium]